MLCFGLQHKNTDKIELIMSIRLASSLYLPDHQWLSTFCRSNYMKNISQNHPPSEQITALRHYFAPFWEPSSYITLFPLKCQLLHHFTPSEQYISLLLHHFTPLAANFQTLLPLRAICPLTLTAFYPHWQLNSYTILYPLNKLPHLYDTNMAPLAAQFLQHFTPLNKLPPHSYTILPPSQPDL